jgi:uncharacterized glyoxalase superfamily protein PhnB
MTVQAHISFGGRCEEALEFYRGRRDGERGAAESVSPQLP